MATKSLRLNLKHFNHAQHRSFQTSCAVRLPAQAMGGRKQDVPHETLIQGNIQDRRKDTKDPQAEAAHEGTKSRHSENPLDAASSQRGSKSASGTEGNPEKVGFVEQVGGQTASAEQFEGVAEQQQEKGPVKEEGAATSGFTSTIRSALGLGHNKENVEKRKK